MDKGSIIQQYRPELSPFEEIYRDIHRNPELSLQEVHTAALVVEFLESLDGYRVIKGIGGHGVVEILQNGSGATVLLRADMDALPHLENINLEYASTKIVKGSDGKETPVMHACDHDMHTAVLLADAKMLLDAKSEWSGTLFVLFRPGEELAVGARAMIEDGLYNPSKFAVPKPDIVLGQHTHAFKAGMIALGGVISWCDCKVLSQMKVRPEEFAVIGCASIHGGSTANIIPDFVDLKISIRSYNTSIHERLVAAVKRVVYSECEISGSLAIREPEFTTTMHAPPTVNDFPAAEILKKSFGEYFGKNLIPVDPFGASEDFSYLALGCDAPYVFYNFGCVDEDTWEEAKTKGTMEDIPHNHSALFAPKI